LHQAQAGGEYVYGVTQLKNFDTWRVERIQ
jgi:hypothetical protein